MNIREELLKTNLFEDNVYFKSYCDLLQSNTDNIYDTRIYQQHHIIPRCYYRRKDKVKINQHAINNRYVCITLSFSDHILAHLYLVLCFKQMKRKLKCACKAMVKDYYKFPRSINESNKRLY